MDTSDTDILLTNDPTQDNATSDDPLEEGLMMDIPSNKDACTSDIDPIVIDISSDDQLHTPSCSSGALFRAWINCYSRN